ncbi:hypothetical protein [Streptomyces sp. NPDC006610]|uniref:hypothetical protein n=1 Tax=Streptomyces sp. NPDC006610 TaxID=3154584 RepID=UPI00339FD30D
MTPSSPSSKRGRSRRAPAHISVRIAHTALGVTAAVVWLVSVMTVTPGGPGVPDAPARAGRPAAAPSPVAAAAREDDVEETATADLVLPLVAVGAAGAVAAYACARRTRRARSRTTPGGTPVRLTDAPSPDPGPERQARALLVEADDCVRTCREELLFAEAVAGPQAVAPYAAALRAAESELSAAFRMRQRYDEGVPAEETARRHALAGIVGRCAEAGRRLDAQAAAFDVLRGLERGPGPALEVAEARFRELAAVRAPAAESLLADLGKRYAPGAVAPVAGHLDRAKDRLVFATTRLNLARQCADRDEPDRAAAHLRAAEGAVAQAGVLVAGVERFAEELAEAEGLVPAALTGAETELAAAGAARAVRADAVPAAVRAELTGGPYDPLDALRRIVRAVTPLASGRAGVLGAAAELAARSAVGAAEDYATTHRGVVGAEARTRLTAAHRLLPDDPLTADALAHEARTLAERDVRDHGHLETPLLAGVLLAGPADPAPASYGGPRTRARRGTTSGPS